MEVQFLLIGFALLVPALGNGVGYIIGGDEVIDAEQWPWQCSLRSYGSHSCGASVISSTWLVTAAHCISGTSGRSIRCGSLDRLYGGVLRDVLEVIRHESYGQGEGSYPNDIAVIRVEELPFSAVIKPVTMATTAAAGNPDCHITGWGDTAYFARDTYLSYMLQEAKVNVYTQEECMEDWGSTINDGHVCLGDKENGRGSCSGDSGGPLVCRIGTDYQLVGVTSWGVASCSTDYPSVYSRVSYFRDWIREKTGI